MASVNPTRVDSGLRLVEARIRNFRSLRAVDIRFDKLTVLIGENNSGKTSLLEALYAAIGAGRRVLTSDDLFLGIGEAKVPRERTIVIDLLFRPADPSGILDEFPEGSYWLELWGTGISQDADDNDFMAIRTKMAWNTGKAEYETKRQFLAEWSSAADLDSANTVPGAVATAQLEPIALYLLDAKRDIQDELQSRSSFWHKLISDPGLPEKTVTKIERILSKLNADGSISSMPASSMAARCSHMFRPISTIYTRRFRPAGERSA
jgi:putative ATP-dependent endonuclease of OLD family